MTIKTNTKKALLSAVFFQLLFIADAQTSSGLDTIVSHASKSFINDRTWMKLSAGIITNGKTHLYNYGAARNDKDQPLFEIGSITKSFTSLILAHAILEKKVKPTDDIRKYLRGDYPNLAYAGKPIQLLHLVNLTSRLPNNMPDNPEAFKTLSEDSFAFAFVNLHKDYTRSKFLEDLHGVKLDTIPGINPRHSNSAAMLLVYILENVYQKPYAELIKDYILKPLQMNHTYLAVPDHEMKSLAVGYTSKGRPIPYVPQNDVIAFGLKSTVADMTRYIQFHLEEKDPAVKLTHQPAWGDANTFALGMNWFMSKTGDGKRKINNDGTTFGFTTYILLYPDLKFGSVIMTNEYDQASNDRLGELAEQIFEESFYTPSQRASDGFGFSAAINQLLDQLKKKGFDKAIAVAGEMKKADPRFSLNENEVNNWGYFLLGKGKKEEALEIFKLNVSLYPESANVYDSLGEIYALLGNKESAIKNYERSLELNPQNANAAEQLKKLGKQ